MTWQLQEAKNKLSQVVDATLTEGPQIITRRGKNTVVLVTYKDFIANNKPAKGFKEFLKDFKNLDFPEVQRSSDRVGRATPFLLDELGL
jgi:prevent-host-death family protein